MSTRNEEAPETMLLTRHDDHIESDAMEGRQTRPDDSTATDANRRIVMNLCRGNGGSDSSRRAMVRRYDHYTSRARSPLIWPAGLAAGDEPGEVVK